MTEMKKLFMAAMMVAMSVGMNAQTVQPKFNGDLDHYIYRNFIFSVVLEENEIRGVAEIGFFVETDGSLTNVEILKGDDDTLNRMAEAFVKRMPKWIPGTVNGVATRMKTSVAIEFGTEKFGIQRARAFMKEKDFDQAREAIEYSRGGKMYYIAGNALIHKAFESKDLYALFSALSCYTDSFLKNSTISRSSLEKESDEFYPAIWNGEQPSVIYDVADEMPTPKNFPHFLYVPFKVSDLKKADPNFSVTFPPGKNKGKILLIFVVEKDGTLSNFSYRAAAYEGIEVTKAGSGLFMVALLRCCFPDENYQGFLPGWKPAIHKGKPVRCHYTLPITIENI